MSKSTNITRTAILSVILIAIMVLVPMIFGMGGQFSTESKLKQFFFYVPFGGIMLLALIQMVSIESNIFHTQKYGAGLGYATPGEKPSMLPFLKKYSNFQIFLISLIAMGIIGLFVFSAYPNIMFQEIPKEQFTKFDSLIYSSSLIPIAENAGLAVVLALYWLGLRYYCIKKNLGDFNFMALSWLAVGIGVIYGIVSHTLVYGASEQSLVSVGAFWGFMSLLTLLTGSFIPAWILHFYNNFFLSLKALASNEATFVYMLVFVLIISAIYAKMYIFTKKKPEVSYG